MDALGLPYLASLVLTPVVLFPLLNARSSVDGPFVMGLSYTLPHDMFPLPCDTLLTNTYHRGTNLRFNDLEFTSMTVMENVAKLDFLLCVR